MAEIKEKADELVEHVTEYAETYYKLGMLKLTEKSSSIGSSLIGTILLIVFGFFFMLFLGMGLSLWIGGMINSTMGGYFIVAGIYLIVILFLVAMRKKLIEPYFRNFIVRKIYE